MLNKLIYVDNAATTQVLPEVLDAMLPYFVENYGNPSSIYSIGRSSRNVIEKSRANIAKCINADAEEIYFTSGGSESDNWAIKLGAWDSFNKNENKKNIITSKIEHHAVINSANDMKKHGFDVKFLSVDSFGIINFEELIENLNENTSVVSVMMANNEIGTIEPIEEISKICKEKKISFHTDAVQAIGNIDVDVKKIGCDMLSFSAHKFGGPKGVGVLYIKKGTNISPFINGGGQEKKMRSGTENIAGIVGMDKALEISIKNLKIKRQKLLNFQEQIINNFLKINSSKLNGHPVNRIPGNINFSFQGIEGEGIILNLDNLGICASTGSACTSSSLEASHVLLAIGLSHEISHGSLRISLGNNNTQEEIDYIIKVVPGIIDKLRKMSPLWKD